MTKSPTVRHRRLGRELRQLREKAGLMPEEAAQQLGWSRPKVNRIENARTMPSVANVAEACDLYGTDSATKAGLIQLCKDARQRGWWTAYSDVFTGSYIALEAEAAAVHTWQPLLIPGLFQTEDYARELFALGLPNLSDSERQRHVSARMARKVILTAPSSPVIHAVIDESVIYRCVRIGGDVMLGQLDALIDASARPNTTIQVLPYGAGFHRGLEGPFSVLRFGAPDPDVGYSESPAGDTYVEAADQVRQFMLSFERLAGAALSPEESAALIAAMRSET